MFHGANFSQFTTRNVVIWFTLAFQAGIINAGGFLSCQRFVSHTTGFATLFGTDFARGEYVNAFGMLTVPLFFVCGSMMSAFFVDRRMIRNEAPRYLVILGALTGLNFFVALAGQLSGFGVFGAEISLAHDYSLLACLCFMCGLQNAMITSASGAVVRTTHLTGLTTDLGIGLVRVLSHNHKMERHMEVRATWMRLGIIASFTLGSTISAFLFLRHQYAGFLMAALISACLWIVSWRRQKTHPWRERLLKAAGQ